MEWAFVISTYANPNDIMLTVIKNNPYNQDMIIFFYWIYVCGLAAIFTSLSKWNCKHCLSRTSLEADGRTKWSVQGAAIFLYPDQALVTAVHTLFSRGHYWTKRETYLWPLSQRGALQLCGGWTHGRLEANNQTLIDNSPQLGYFWNISTDSAAEISVKAHFVTR